MSFIKRYLRTTYVDILVKMHYGEYDVVMDNLKCYKVLLLIFRGFSLHKVLYHDCHFAFRWAKKILVKKPFFIRF